MFSIKGIPTLMASAKAQVDNTEWTLVVIPDTQRLAPNNPTAYNTLFQWVVDNVDDENIKMVMHLGDYVNLGSSDAEWGVVDTAVNRLHGEVPLVHCAGNHDYDDDAQGSYSRKTTKWENVFPESDWTGYDWYIDSYEDITTNMAVKLTIGDTTVLFLTMEVWPRAGVLTWADSVIANNPTDQIYLATHAMTAPDGSYETDENTATGGQSGVPQYYGICNNSTDGDCKTGLEIYNEFVKKHDNIGFVFNGHDVVNNNGEVTGQGIPAKTAFSKRTDMVNGKTINTHLFNYQNENTNSYQNSAYLRLYRIKNDGTFSVETYNPVRDTNLTDGENQFNGAFN